MKQMCVTPAMGKRLIGRAMAQHPEIQRVLRGGALVIIAGTTNGYVAQEVLANLGQGEAFSREGFRRGLVVAPGAQVPTLDFPGDVVVRDGVWNQGETIFDAVGGLKAGDVVVKGGNALDPRGQAAVQIGHPQGGTVLPSVAAVVGRRVKIIVPIGLEKRVFEDVNVLAQLCCARDGQGPRLYPILGETFTEIEAIRLLSGAEARLLGAGGVYGGEGAVWLGLTGNEQEIEAAVALIRSVAGEPACLV